MAKATSVLGRPRGFDEDAALERSMLMFWQVGYDGTSVRDLGTVMGVGQTS